MKLTKTERLIIYNQNEILSKISDDKDYYEANMEILSSGFEFDYYRLFGPIDDDVYTKELCEETIDILQMFRRFDNILNGVSQQELKEIGDDVKKLKFQGFDANNDKHYFYAKFMIEKLGKWDEQRNKYLNSHNALTIQSYRKMISTYKSMNLDKKYNLNFDDLKTLLSEI